MVVRNLKTIRPTIWIPPRYTANHRLTVERSDGTIDDLTDTVSEIAIEDSVTDGIGIFSFNFWNPNEEYTGVYTGMEIVRYYSNYSKTARTLRFRGRIEKPSAKDNQIFVTGRSESLFVMDEQVTYSGDTVDIGLIIHTLFTNYGNDRFDLSEIDTVTGTTLSVNWIDRNFMDCVADVCNASGYDCYVNCNLIVKFFVQGSITNTAEGIVHDHNLYEVSDFAPDLQFVKNKIRVMGATIDGVQVIYTANDTDSQATYGVRRHIETDSSITDFDVAKDLGDHLLALHKDPPITGTVKGALLASIQPGEMIRLSSPLEGLAVGDYRVIHYKHEITDEEFATTVTINKEPRKLSHVLKDRIQRENRTEDTTSNSYDLDYAMTELFNSHTGLNTNTEIVEGRLKLIAAGSGTWISNTLNTPDSRDVNTFSVRALGDDMAGIAVEMSFDGGITYNATVLNDLETTTTSQGSDIRFKITLDSVTQSVDSVGIQYNTKA